MTDPTTRFTDRVEDYVRYRPGYPDALPAALLANSGCAGGSTAADIGSGTGIFSEMLLAAGLLVYAVEPNAAMRRAAEQRLGEHPRFHSLDASAEHTGLEPASLDLVTAAQAFHWFNNDAALNEFRRILKPEGLVALVWNRRNLERSFQQAYHELLLAFAPEYGKINHMNLQAADIERFFAPAKMRQQRFENQQRLDFTSLLGRLKSSSYCPREDSPLFIPLVDELQLLFDRHVQNGQVDFDYHTDLYLGPVHR